MAASQVLYEGMSGDDEGGCSFGGQAAHRPQPVLEPAVVRFDAVVGIPFDVMPRGRRPTRRARQGRPLRRR